MRARARPPATSSTTSTRTASDSGEPGLPGWIVWADYDDDGIRDDGEPFGITDAEVITSSTTSVRETGRMLRETLATELGFVARRAGVACSYPNAGTTGGTGSAPGGLFHCGWGPIESARTSYARFKDFGNYVPATLVVEKQLEPSSDPGRFDLLVNQTVVIAGAGDGAFAARESARRLHGLGEAAVGTNPANYRSTVECKVGTRRTRVRSGGVYADLRVRSGQLAVCTFRNVRLGRPMIAIDKVGPASATAGDTLRYQLFVSNPGFISFPAASVRVVDPNCDPQPPALVGKADPPAPMPRREPSTRAISGRTRARRRPPRPRTAGRPSSRIPPSSRARRTEAA